jgi:SAM-dependent methyltransferase
MQNPPVRDWLGIPFVNSEYIFPRVSGSLGVDWFGYVLGTYGNSVEGRSVLDLGCGPGVLEQQAFEAGVAFGQAIAFDLSAAAISEGRRIASAAGYSERVEFRCDDFTVAEFPERLFDCILINMALHYVVPLEHLAAKLARWKMKDGIVAISESLGPNRFQWAPEALLHGNRLLATIPEHLRVHGISGKVVKNMWCPDLAGMVANNPSEVVRSEEIVEIIEGAFEVVERRDYGATLLHPLLADIAHNFQPFERKEDELVLRSLFPEEQRLIQSDELQSNFTFMVLR